MEDMKATGTTFDIHAPSCSGMLMGIFFLDSLPQCSSARIWNNALDGPTRKRRYHCGSTTYSASSQIQS